MSDDDFKRLENKVDALLMGLLQISYVQEMQTLIDHNRDLRQNWSTRAEERDGRPIMSWNSEQALKVLRQGIKGEKPDFDQ